jgi:hypothetical protein
VALFGFGFWVLSGQAGHPGDSSRRSQQHPLIQCVDLSVPGTFFLEIFLKLLDEASYAGKELGSCGLTGRNQLKRKLLPTASC